MDLQAKNSGQKGCLRASIKRKQLSNQESLASAGAADALGWLRLGLLRLGWLVWWRVMSCCCCLFPGFCGGEPCRADVACWGGWGPHTPCARQIGPHPPQPTPPSRHGSLRCVWVRRQQMRVAVRSSLHRFASIWLLFLSSRVTPHSGAGAHGIARARGEPFRQSLLAVCGGRLTP